MPLTETASGSQADQLRKARRRSRRGAARSPGVRRRSTRSTARGPPAAPRGGDRPRAVTQVRRSRRPPTRASSDGKSVADVAQRAPRRAARRSARGARRPRPSGPPARRLVGERDAGRGASAGPSTEPVRVEPDPDRGAVADRGVDAGTLQPPARRAHGDRSPGSVSLRLAGSPANDADRRRPPRPGRRASSVIGRPQACASSMAARSAPSARPAASGRPRPRRGRPAPTTRSSRDSLQGVDDRDDRDDGARRPTRPARRRRATSSGVTRRTRRVVDEDQRVVREAGRGQGREAGDDRVGAHVAARHDEARARSAGRERIGESLDAHRPGPPARRWPGRASASSASRLQRQTGRPQMSIHSLSLPIRRLRPAATRIAAYGRLIGPCVRRQSTSRGCAKIIRPATVWSTRVTLIGTSLSMKRHAALDHDHRAVVQVADALAGLLALLDDLDAHLLAGVDDRLHRVGQLVDVQDPDALQLRHAVEVVVVGEDGGAVCRARRPSAWRRPRRPRGTSPRRPRPA